jgi:hypothetical protein
MALSRLAIVSGLALAIAGAAAFPGEAPPALPPHPLSAHFPWTSADVPPPIAGLHLGDPRSTVESVLGTATEVRAAGSGLVAEYPTQGLAILLNATGEVAMIYLLTRTAGSIDGVRVGDSREQILAQWGEPPLIQGAQAMYPAGDWAIVVELGPEQRVLSVSLGRAYGNTDLQ